MSIASEITRINTNISNAYTACNNKGATMPVTQNSDNLATTISSISSGISPSGSTNINTNGTHDVTNYANAIVAVPQGILTCITDIYTVSSAKANQNVTLISGNSFIASNYNNSKAFALVVRISGLQTNGINMAINTNQEFGVIQSSGKTVYGLFSGNTGTEVGNGNRQTTPLNTSPPNTVGNVNADSNGNLIIKAASGSNALYPGDYFIMFGLME